MVMTYSHAYVQGQRLASSKDRVETNGQTDRQMKVISLPLSLMWSVISRLSETTVAYVSVQYFLFLVGLCCKVVGTVVNLVFAELWCEVEMTRLRRVTVVLIVISTYSVGLLRMKNVQLIFL